MKQGHKSGFTLIELLVVIAIIAILAGILFPVFAKARERAFTADCTANTRQLAIAFGMYAGDYDQKFPSGGNGWNGLDRGSDWVKWKSPGCTDASCAGNMSVEEGTLFPYVKESGAYVCKNALVASEKSQSGGTRTSYTMNSNLVYSTGGVAGGASWLGIKVNRVSFPAQTFLLIEENDEELGWGTGRYNDSVFYATDNPANGWDEPPGKNDASSRHGNGALAAYVDGHAKWHPFGELVPYVNNQPSKLLPYYFARRPLPDQMP